MILERDVSIYYVYVYCNFNDNIYEIVEITVENWTSTKKSSGKYSWEKSKIVTFAKMETKFI